MGYENDLFVQQPVDNDLVCAICYDVLENPITVCTGEHIFCQSCVDSWTMQQNKNNCPTCRVPMVKEPIVSRRLASKIMVLQVRCPEKDDENINPEEEGDDDEDHSSQGQEPPKKMQRTLKLRSKTIAITENNDAEKTAPPPAVPVVRPTHCPWTGTLTDFLATHKCNECDYRKTPCSSCNQLVTASKLKAHQEKDCPERLVQCSMCRGDIAACQLQAHKWFQCPRRAVTCSHCGQAFRGPEDLGTYKRDPSDATRFVFSGHMQVCPDLRLPCEFACYGCPAKLKRSEVDTHRKESGGVHSQLLLKQIHTMQDDMKWEVGTFVWNFSKGRLLQLEHEKRVWSGYSTFGGLRVGLQARVQPSDGVVTLAVVVDRQQGFTHKCNGVAVAIEGESGSARCSHSEYPNRAPTYRGPQCFLARPTLRDGPFLTLDTLKDFFGTTETVKITTHFKLLKPNVVVIS